jgi:hypothetical protein
MIAYRYWSNTIPIFYVAGVKGRVGDWEYTTDVNKAIHLTPGQRVRFAADCRAVGVTAQFL